jgi:hypothetical protein
MSVELGNTNDRFNIEWLDDTGEVVDSGTQIHRIHRSRVAKPTKTRLEGRRNRLNLSPSTRFWFIPRPRSTPRE